MSTLSGLNNNGVTLLRNGEHVEALNTFREALDGLCGFMALDDELADTEAIGPCDILSSVPIEKGIFVSDADDATSPHNSYCFYNRAFELPNTPLVESDLEQVKAFSVVMLFNMGITIHHKGLAGGSRSTALLNKALGFYKMILCVHENQEDSRAAPPRFAFRMLKVLLMAVYSNMGHIFSHFFNVEESELYRFKLQNLLASSPELRSAIASEEYVVFFLNATTTVKQAWAPAA